MSQENEAAKPQIPAQRDESGTASKPNNGPGRQAATQKSRANALYHWQPERDEHGNLVLKRPTADTNGNVGNFGRALLRYTNALEKEITDLRTKVAENEPSVRIAELEQELADARAQIEQLKSLEGQLAENEAEAVRLQRELEEVRQGNEQAQKGIDSLLAASKENTAQLNRLTVRAETAERILMLEAILSGFLEAPLAVIRAYNKGTVIGRHFVIGGLNLTMTMQLAAPYKYGLTADSNTDIRVKPYAVHAFNQDGMPAIPELIHLAFLLDAVTEEGYQKNLARFADNPTALAEIYPPQPKGFEETVRALGALARGGHEPFRYMKPSLQIPDLGSAYMYANQGGHAQPYIPPTEKDLHLTDGVTGPEGYAATLAGFDEVVNVASQELAATVPAETPEEPTISHTPNCMVYGNDPQCVHPDHQK